MRVARHVVLSADQQHFLASVAKARSASARSVERAWIVLLAGAGLQDQQIAAGLNITPETAARWRNRFLDLGLMALFQNARPGRPPTITPAKVQEVIRKTTQERPINATLWSTRRMANAAGLSEKSVRRIWHKHGLKPHLARPFGIKAAKTLD
jgi:transposase